MSSNMVFSRPMTDNFLTKATQLGVSPQTHVANLARSGQLGTGVRFTKLDGATPSVAPPAVIVVMNMPSMWDKYPKLQEMVKSIVETHAKSWSGIDFTYNLDSVSAITFKDGQELKVPTKTSRSAVSPSMSVVDYAGAPVWNIFRQWMFDISHPDTNISSLSAMTYDKLPGWYMSAYSMTIAVIQYDISGLPDRIMDGYIITNMFPTAIGEYGFQRDITQFKLLERTIQFTGLVQHNDNTRELCYNLANMLQLHRINYQSALPGLYATVHPDRAIQSELRKMGGLEFEATGAHTSMPGAAQLFTYQGKDASAFTDRLGYASDRIPTSSAITPANLNKNLSETEAKNYNEEVNPNKELDSYERSYSGVPTMDSGGKEFVGPPLQI